MSDSNFRLKFLFFLSFIFVSACATHPSRLSSVKLDLTSGKCETALSTLEEMSTPDGNNRLLYLMEYGSALQICGDYAKSNRVFLQADQLSELVDYHSASRVVGATLLNEEMIQYKGDIFERLFINASAALNYLELRQPDEAMVEVRRINEKYNKFAAEEKSSFELNAFAQYLSGFIWESQRKYDDACIDYQKAYRLDPAYRQVGLDALSACSRAGRAREYSELQKKISPSDEELKYVKRKVTDEITVFYLQGLGPHKEPRPNDHVFPYLVSTPSVTSGLLATFNGETRMSQSIYNVEKAAIATLEADYGSLAARRIGARISKEVVADQIRQKDKALGNIAWLVMVASERADLRNWSLLPESIQVLRLQPPKGSKIKLIGLNRYGGETDFSQELDLSLAAGKKFFLIRTLR